MQSAALGDGPVRQFSFSQRRLRSANGANARVVEPARDDRSLVQFSREQHTHNGLEPTPVGRDPVGIPRLEGCLYAGYVRIGEFKVVS